MLERCEKNVSHVVGCMHIAAASAAGSTPDTVGPIQLQVPRSSYGAPYIFFHVSLHK